MTELEPIEIHWPEYHSSAMGCGLEDRGIHNRYDTMLHGWECAVERCMEAVPDEPIVLASEVVKVLAAKDTETARLRAAAADVIASAADTYKKRNGHLGSFQNDSGEKCWIVPFDAFEGLRTAVSTTMEDILRRQAKVNVLRPARYEGRGNVVHKLPVKVLNETNTGDVFEVGFPVCTASEYVEATAIAALLDRGERVLEAAGGIADDYMTSEHHHPGYVLIPTAKFEAIRAALLVDTAEDKGND